jgi:hypothetical protein
VLHRCRFCRGEEANYSATSLHCPSDNLRQILMEALHPKLVHADLRQFGAKFPSRRGKKLQICSSNGRLIRKWIGKVENFAPRHFHTPGFTEAEKVARPARANAMSNYFLTDDRQELLRGSTWAARKMIRYDFAINVFRAAARYLVAMHGR